MTPDTDDEERAETPREHARTLAETHHEAKEKATRLRGQVKQADQEGGAELAKLRSKVQKAKAEVDSIKNDPFYDSDSERDADLRPAQKRLDRAEEDLAAEGARWEERLEKLHQRRNQAESDAREARQELEAFCERREVDHEQILEEAKPDDEDSEGEEGAGA